MVVIAYNEAIDTEAMEALGKCGIIYYTKINAAYGSGKASGMHLGNEVWPGRNNILYVACEEREAKKLILLIKELCKTLGKEGIKAFVMPVEEMT